MTPSRASSSTGQRRRADAERSAAAILDAAVDALGGDPDVSMAAIARRAGVVRATIYVHFPTREALIAAVSQRAIAEASEALRAARPDGAPADALARMLASGWRTLGRYHALVAINTRLGAAHARALHKPVLGLIRPLLKRGQASGAFNPDLPLDWMLTVLLELMHAASREVATGLPEEKAERALIASVTGAFSPPTNRRRARRHTSRSPQAS
jgi:AcrR family transcriptional regulator